MSRYIDADIIRDEWLHGGENEHIYDTNDFLDSIDYQPTADVEPVRHAHWIVKVDDDMDNEMYHCSNCGEEQFFSNYYGEEQEKFPYCPMCGAKMDEKVD